MIRNPDLQSFVCCAVCNKIIPPPPSGEAFHRIQEYKPFKTRFLTHKDILDFGIKIHQQEEKRQLIKVEELLKIAQDEVWAKAEAMTDEAVKKAIKKVKAKHLEEIEVLKEEHEQILKQAVKEARKEVKEFMEAEMRRENLAAEQRMVHRIQKILKECHTEKIQAIETVRAEEQEMAMEALKEQKRKNEEKIIEAGILSHKNLEKSIKEVAKATEHQMNINFSLSQKKKEEEVNEVLNEAEKVHRASIKKVAKKLTVIEGELQEKTEQLENMTHWKDFLEEELLETREAFQKYINFTYPTLSPGQADFILPLRKKPPSDLEESIAVTEEVPIGEDSEKSETSKTFEKSDKSSFLSPTQ
ncbi:uncharacterized protein C6orf163 homolog [Monodelphis domestica]|uniref:Uncharacterized protein n=1 Tax=Monodelphis domestica TaxID=13616 RepID=A0A5F8GS96_MONDO|nr:uncharacterized protein C6orf163 homolog [Monodelphis domestica]